MTKTFVLCLVTRENVLILIYLLIPFVRIIDDSHQYTDIMHFHGLHSNRTADLLPWIIKPKMSIFQEKLSISTSGLA